jgi:YVTN family beta-propeller protein
VSPDGSTVYVTNNNADTVSVINTASNMVSATIPVGGGPLGVAVSPDGSTVYVTNNNADTVSVINTASNTVTATTLIHPLRIASAAL